MTERMEDRMGERWKKGRREDGREEEERYVKIEED
jgi:hypothetical protein